MYVVRFFFSIFHIVFFFFFFQAEDGIRDLYVTGVQTCALPICLMLHAFEDIISYISRFILLKKGDIIFTGTPKGVGPVKIGDRLEAFLEDKKEIGRASCRERG